MKKLLVIAALTIGITSINVSAHATVITFDSLASPMTARYSDYSESGYMITSNFPYYGFWSWGSNSDHYAGSQALLNGAYDGITTIAKVGGGSFTLNSIMLSEYTNQPYYEPITVTFWGKRAGGGTSSFQTVLDSVFGFQMIDFGDTFTDVTSVYWEQQSPFHQFDDIRIDKISAPVPEPSTFTLVATAVGLGCVFLRRKTIRHS